MGFRMRGANHLETAAYTALKLVAALGLLQHINADSKRFRS